MRNRVSIWVTVIILTVASSCLQRPVRADDLPPTATTTDFFTTAADALLRSRFNGDTNYTVTNLWIYSSTNPAVGYTPEIHRCLQVAANLLNNLTNNTVSEIPFTFRPKCRREFGPGWTNLYITGYSQLSNSALSIFDSGIKNLQDPTISSNDIVWGLPFIVASRDSSPGFSQCQVTNLVGVSRRLAFGKTFANYPDATNQSYFYSLTNGITLEMQNASTQAPNRAITILVTNQLLLAFTNELSTGHLLAGLKTNHYDAARFEITSNQWPASTTMPVFSTNLAVLPWSRYSERYGTFSSDGTAEITNGFPVHDWMMRVTNRFCIAMIDSSTGRLLDFLNLGDIVTSTNLNQALAVQSTGVPLNANVWLTNGANHSLTSMPSQGVLNQVAISLGTVDPPGPLPPESKAEIESLRYWWTAPVQTSTLNRVAWYCPVAFIPSRSNFTPSDRYTRYTLGDMIDPVRFSYFETNGWLVTEYDYPNRPVRTITNTPSLVVSNGFVSAYDRDTLVIGPYVLPGAHPSQSLTVMDLGSSNYFGFSWPTTIGQRYTVEMSFQLPHFAPYPTMTASSTQSVFMVPASNRAQFYRVRAEHW